MSASSAGLGPTHNSEYPQKFAELTENVLFGDIWKRAQLTLRERSLATVSALVALYRLEQLPFHLKRALDNGLAIEELDELLTHLAFYSGWPTAASELNLLNTLRNSPPIDQE
ncbi:carboxymuconolactone decarboxylase family protein [Pseudomonas putida]|uniref:carboxymuconolactone decarboxylase family protein n=1 Tax=Pseudomonas putida TaxID=303 RepID=UPI0010753EAF|nr:carboxymuconolactone decarboxylase family protein [Pseudomonas putida]TFW38594.1 carboxymuconolactone decarboxylase family protein [Pseudomonas putida]